MFGQHTVEHGGQQIWRGPEFTHEQERAIKNLVLANNAIRLREIQAPIVNHQTCFINVQQVSLSITACKKHQVLMTQLYKVPFERNADRVTVLRREYVVVRFVH